MKNLLAPTHLLLSCALAVFPAVAETTRPNIIVILADDVGWGDAGCYGATKVKTPHIDRLAREGQRFVNGHASAAVCTPTRYSLITGQYSWRRDATGLNKGVSNGDSPLLIPTDMTTAPGLLKEAGYRTAVIGKWHLGFGLTKPNFNQELRPGPLEIGFHEFFGIPATNDRIPTVFVRDHRVVGLDEADPIRYSYNESEAEKYFPDLNFANGWKGGHIKPGIPARPALYDLSDDPGETSNLLPKRAADAARLSKILAEAQSKSITRPQ